MKTVSCVPSLRLCLIVACVAVLLAPAAGVAQTTWSGATSTDPTVAGNWSSGVPSGSSLATFSTSAASPANMPTFGASDTATWLGISFSTGGPTDLGAYTLTPPTSGSLTLGASGIVNASTASGSQTIAAGNLTLSGSAPFTQSGSSALMIVSSVALGSNTLTLNGTGNGQAVMSGVISGSGGSLTKSDTGSWTLSGANVNTYTGATRVNGGTFALTFNNLTTPTNLISSSSALVLGGGTLSVTGKSSGSSAQTFAGTTFNSGASSVTVNSNGGTDTSLTLGAFTRNVGSTVSFTRPSSGNLLITAGDGFLGGWATVGTNHWATVTSGNIFTANYTDNTWGSGTNTNVTTSATISGSSTTNSLRFNASGATTLTLSGTNTIESGGILVTSAVGSNATTITGGILKGANGTDLVVIQNNTPSSLTIASDIQDNTTATGLTKSGGGSLILTGSNNTYTGVTTINSGSLQIGAHGTGASIGTGNIVNNGTSLSIINGSSLTIPGVISGTGQLSKSDAGMLTLSGVNTYTGGTMVNGGTLKITGSLNGTTGTNLTFGSAGGTFEVSQAAGSTQGMGVLAFNGGDGTIKSTYPGSGTTTLSFTNVMSRQAGATGNFDTSSGGGTSNKIVLTQFTNSSTPTGTLLDKGLFFNGSNYAAYDASGYVRAYTTGDTNAVSSAGGSTLGVNDDTKNVFLTTANVTAQTSASVNTINATGAFNITLGGSQTLSVNGILKSGGSSTATISGGSGITTVAGSGEMVIRTDVSSDALTISTPILNNSGSSLTKTGAGTLTLSAVNAYTGATRINAGTVTVDSGSNVSTGTLNVAAGATLNLNNSSTQSVGDLTGGGTINLANALAVTAGAGGAPFSGAIIGAGSLSLAGPHTLSGVNNYSGGTTISSGMQTFSGANTNIGNVSVSGGALRIGASNTIPNASNLTLSGGALELSGAFTDSLGTLTIGIGNGTINFGSYAGALAFADSSAASWSGTLSITNYVSGTSSLRFGTGSGALIAGQLSAISFNGFSPTGASIDSSGYLTPLGAIPEASTYAVWCGLGALALAVYRRRRALLPRR